MESGGRTITFADVAVPGNRCDPSLAGMMTAAAAFAAAEEDMDSDELYYRKQEVAKTRSGENR